jgi:NAD-dependent dihydropyrimidine dehydrogenase PreA subunit
MPFVITEPCIGVKDGACVDVCPVECIAFSATAEMFFINPETCISCTYCESACPVNAIFDLFTGSAQWRHYIMKNRDFFKGKK